MPILADRCGEMTCGKTTKTRANRCDILEMDGYRVAAVGRMTEALAPHT